jgi:hypothetical protein
MAIRPSFKLESNGSHGLVSIERASEGVDIDIWDVGLVQPDESLTLNLSYEEAIEFSAMLRSVLGQDLSPQEATVLGF